MASIEATQLLAVAAAACEDKKAEDIRILKLDPTESGLTDYFLICTGLNERQNVAITDEIEIRLKREYGVYPNSVEGRRQGEWVLMDYVDFIVHVFSVEKRAFYGLERLRKTATSLSLEELNEDLKQQIADLANSRKATRVVAKTAVKGVGKAVAKKAVAGKKTLPAKPAAAKKTVGRVPEKKTISARTLEKRAAKKTTKAVVPKKNPRTKAVAKKAATKPK